MIFFIEVSLGVRSCIENFSLIISAVDEPQLKYLLKPLHLAGRSQPFRDPILDSMLLIIEIILGYIIGSAPEARAGLCIIISVE